MAKKLQGRKPGPGAAPVQPMSAKPTPPEMTQVKHAPPTVEVLMPVFNRGRLVAESIRSIQEQTFRDFRLTIYDDGSTDDTPFICERLSFDDPRIRYIRNFAHKGIVEARNALLDACESKIACWQDSDDISHPRRLETMLVALMDHRINCDQPNQDLGLGQVPCIVMPRSEFFVGPFRRFGRMEIDRIEKNWYCGPHDDSEAQCVQGVESAKGLNCGGSAAAMMFIVDKSIRFVPSEVKSRWAPWLGEDCTWVGKLVRAGYAAINLPDVLYYIREHPERMSNVVRSLAGSHPDMSFAQLLELHRQKNPGRA